MNNECTVCFILPAGPFCQTVSLAGEEAARVVSTERHLVTLPLPPRVQVMFTPLLFPKLLHLCPVVSLKFSFSIMWFVLHIHESTLVSRRKTLVNYFPLWYLI